MDRIRKFIRLPLKDRWLLLKAAGLLAAIRFSLYLFPFPAVRPLLDRASKASQRLLVDPPRVEHLAWAVTVAGGVIPRGGHCLSQALALHILLARRGFPSKICYGVQREPGAPFMAHAWVEHDGVVLIGGNNLNRFIRLTSTANPPF